MSGTRRDDALQPRSLLRLDPSPTRGWGFVAVGRPGYSGTVGSPSSLSGAGTVETLFPCACFYPASGTDTSNMPELALGEQKLKRCREWGWWICIPVITWEDKAHCAIKQPCFPPLRMNSLGILEDWAAWGRLGGLQLLCPPNPVTSQTEVGTNGPDCQPQHLKLMDIYCVCLEGKISPITNDSWSISLIILII